MTTKVLGLVFYANLAPQQVSDATAGPALRPRVLTGQSSSNQSGDGAVWTAQPSSDLWEGDEYPPAAVTVPLSDAASYDASPYTFRGDNRSAIVQYQFYANLLAAPYYSSLSLYA